MASSETTDILVALFSDCSLTQEALKIYSQFIRLRTPKTSRLFLLMTKKLKKQPPLSTYKPSFKQALRPWAKKSLTLFSQIILRLGILRRLAKSWNLLVVREWDLSFLKSNLEKHSCLRVKLNVELIQLQLIVSLGSCSRNEARIA